MWGYVLTHWQGRQSLPRSALINGLLLYLLLVLGLVVIGQLSNNNQVVITLGFFGFLLWMIWALVGVFRCGIRVTLDRGKPARARVGGTVAIVGVAVVMAGTINDLIHLARF